MTKKTAERGFWERTRASWALILLSLIAVYLAFSSTRRTPLPADVVFLWAVIVMILGVIAWQQVDRSQWADVAGAVAAALLALVAAAPKNLFTPFARLVVTGILTVAALSAAVLVLVRRRQKTPG